MSTLQSQSFVFDPRPDYPLVSTVKRYWRPNSPYLADADAFTLIFVHGTNFHKEIWEPTIDDLFAMKGGKIRDVWSIDAPNHGDAAMLNEEVLQWGYETCARFTTTFFILLSLKRSLVRWEEYARLLHAFLLGLGTGVDVNFRKRRLIGVGHSSGAGALYVCMFVRRWHFNKLTWVLSQIAHPVTVPPHSLRVFGPRRDHDHGPGKLSSGAGGFPQGGEQTRRPMAFARSCVPLT